MEAPGKVELSKLTGRDILAGLRWVKGLRQRVRIPILPSAILLLLTCTAIFAPLLAPYNPTEGSLIYSLLPPFWMEGGSMQFPLGTDFQGRDILSRIIFGSRVSLIVALLTIFLSGGVGSILGIASGYYGGVLDAVIMRLADIFFALPSILLALVFAYSLGPSLQNVVMVIGLVLWSRFARQIRGEVLGLREREFVALARVAGASGPRIMLKHILPNVANTIIVMATWLVGFVILLEATLSFLGVGVPPPTPSWGLMISDGRRWIGEAWWVSVMPGLAMLLTVLAINLFGDWLRDYLDPRLRQL